MPKSRASRIVCPNDIVDASRPDPSNPFQRIYNGGWHPEGKRNYRKAVRTITKCLHTYKRARLFHLCFKRRTNDEHKALLHALTRKLDSAAIPCEWFSARETDGGEHLHIFLIVDSEAVDARSIVNSYRNQFLGKEARKRGIRVYVNRPKNEIHNRKRFVELPWLSSSRPTSEEAMARLDDAMIWLTYIYKTRGKPESAVLGQIFSASRPNRKRAGTPVDGPIGGATSVAFSHAQVAA